MPIGYRHARLATPRPPLCDSKNGNPGGWISSRTARGHSGRPQDIRGSEEVHDGETISSGAIRTRGDVGHLRSSDGAGARYVDRNLEAQPRQVQVRPGQSRAEESDYQARSRGGWRHEGDR